eukprot:jgi/Chrpa1/20586/Chrysochromulina_OHIO_Genome00022374-RA
MGRRATDRAQNHARLCLHCVHSMFRNVTQRPAGIFTCFAFVCLQGGGVYVQGGTVTLSSCTISGNTAYSVRAHLQKFPSPDGNIADVLASIHACTTANISVNYRRAAVSTSIPARSRLRLPRSTGIQLTQEVTLCVLMFKSSHGPDGNIADALTSTLACTTTAVTLLSMTVLPIAPMMGIADALASTLAQLYATAADASINFRVYGGGGVYVAGGTVAISSCTITGNTATYVRADVQKFPSPRCGKIADVLAPTHACTTANAPVNYRIPSKVPIALMGDSRFARCLQGGGVYVYSGTVAISSCIISGNRAEGVCALTFKSSHHVQKFPSRSKLLTRLLRFALHNCGGRSGQLQFGSYQNGDSKNVYVSVSSLQLFVCTWATALTWVSGPVWPCPAPPPPPSPPDLTLVPTTIFANVAAAITLFGNALTDGATCAFLSSGNATCTGAAARGLFPTGGVLSGGSLRVRLDGPMIYKLCAAPAGSNASLDAHFT